MAADPVSATQHFRHGLLGGIAALAYGLLCYAVFLVTILYAIGFVGNWVVPKSIDSGVPGDPASAVVVNVLLLLLFVAQHTIMARPAFKRVWTTFVPRSVERSTYVLAASACLGLLFAFWRPMPQTVWQTTQPLLSWALVALSLAGWIGVPGSSFVINHFDLFGLRQVWLRFRGRRPAPVAFRVVGPYRFVRHPLMVGFLVAFWATPHMTVGHLLFAVATTGYILFGTWMEERDLVAEHGEPYLEYRRRVPGFVPFMRRPA